MPGVSSQVFTSLAAFMHWQSRDMNRSSPSGPSSSEPGLGS